MGLGMVAARVGIIGATTNGTGVQVIVEVVAASLSRIGRVGGCEFVDRRAEPALRGYTGDDLAEFDNVGKQLFAEDGLVVYGCHERHDVVVVNTCNDCDVVMRVCLGLQLMS